MYRTDNKSIRCARPVRAFTMIEVLVVIAITVILFGLLIRPLVDTLRYTKDAQLQAAAQDSARQTLEILTREIGSAAYVSDNCTHAFNADPTKLDSTINGALREQYSNFLDIQVPSVDPATGQPTTTGALAHVYNAKLDIVMARHTAASGVNSSNMYDPTAGDEPITFDSNGNGKNLVGESGSRITATPLMFPLAPGTTMIRYFIGLKNPDALYSDTRDHINGDPKYADNGYVLYRAQFTPDSLAAVPSLGSPLKTYALFDTDSNTSSPTYNQPILDDPDFFRPVTVNDTNWLDPAHGKYTASQVAAHNLRYETWKLIAKPIINAPEIDLLIMPHKSDRTLDYDTSTGSFPGVAHYGADHDPVTGTDYPMEHTSVQFLPGAVSTDAAPSTTSDYAEKGIAGGTSGLVTGLPYIPTQYQSVGQAWTRPYFAYLYPQKTVSTDVTNIDTQDFFYITQATSSQAAGSGGGNAVDAGDVVEYHSKLGAVQVVYDLTKGRQVGTDGDTIPASVNEDLGLINFSVPAVPDPVNYPFVRTWTYSLNNNPNTPTNTINLVSDPCNMNIGGGTQTYVSPLNNDPSNTTKPLYYAFIVPGSLRVYGPDMTDGPTSDNGQTIAAGPNYGNPVLYTEVSPNTPPGANEYQVDYFNSTITFMPQALDSQNKPVPWPGNFQVIYDYQSNMRPNNRTSSISGGGTTPNPANPLAVKVTYHSRAFLNLSIGVRYIDSYGNAQDKLLSNAVQVGNINR